MMPGRAPEWMWMAGTLAWVISIMLAPAYASQQHRLDEVAFTQRIGEPLASQAVFVNAEGRAVSLRAAAADRPMVLVLSWFNCPDLCPMVLDHLAATTKNLNFAASDYQVAVVSIAAEETPADARSVRQRLQQRQGASAADWQFLTGDDVAIAAVAESVGFAYSYDAQRERYAHPAGLVVIAPGGAISRYILDVSPGLPDLKLALLEAAQGKLGSVADQIILRCYRFDPETGRYNLAVIRLLQGVGGVFLVALALLILLLRRRDPT